MTPPTTMPNPQTVPPVEASAYANPYTATTAPPPMPGTRSFPGQGDPGQVSPGLAFGLGLIPGVGAIYNGQYAKGLTHVVIFGLFVSILAANGPDRGYTPLLALLMVGFCCYMPFEAYHTALRRQRGLLADEFSSLLPVHGGTRFPIAPVVLIALGVVFLLSNLNILDFERLLRDYWPVLLIALGAYMLIARMNASGSGSGTNGSRSSAPERPRDGGGEQ